jgi:hypothetical protein
MAVAIHELRQLAAYELQREGGVNTSTRIDIADPNGRVVERIVIDDVFDS